MGELSMALWKMSHKLYNYLNRKLRYFVTESGPDCDEMYTFLT